MYHTTTAQTRATQRAEHTTLARDVPGKDTKAQRKETSTERHQDWTSVRDLPVDVSSRLIRHIHRLWLACLHRRAPPPSSHSFLLGTLSFRSQGRVDRLSSLLMFHFDSHPGLAPFLHPRCFLLSDTNKHHNLLITNHLSPHHVRSFPSVSCPSQAASTIQHITLAHHPLCSGFAYRSWTLVQLIDPACQLYNLIRNEYPLHTFHSQNLSTHYTQDLVLLSNSLLSRRNYRTGCQDLSRRAGIPLFLISKAIEKLKDVKKLDSTSMPVKN